MNTVETILMRHGIDATLVSNKQKEQLKNHLEEAKSGNTQSFSAFSNQILSETERCSQFLLQQTEALLSVLELSKKSVERVVGKYPSTGFMFHTGINRKTLTDGHLQLLTELEMQKDLVSSVAEEVAENEQSQINLMELSLRQIALCETETNQHLCQCYSALSNAIPAFVEKTEKCRTALLDLCHQCHEQMSTFAGRSSNIITAIHASKIPQSDYYNLLQSALLQYHALHETARLIQKEVPHVQISDVL